MNAIKKIQSPLEITDRLRKLSDLPSPESIERIWRAMWLKSASDVANGVLPSKQIVLIRNDDIIVRG